MEKFRIAKDKFLNFFSSEKPRNKFAGLKISDVSLQIQAENQASPWKRIVRGSCSQADIESQYKNAQCTSMAVTAAAYNCLKNISQWGTKDIDYILEQGDKNHHNFREVFGFSNNKDRRVALDDIPKTCLVDLKDKKDPVGIRKAVVMKTGEWAGPIFLPEEGYDESFRESCPDLRYILETHLKSNRPIAVTLNEFSVAFFKVNGMIWMFDSHQRNEKGRYSFFGKAFVVPFPNFDELFEYLRTIYKSDDVYYANALKVWIPEEYSRTHQKILQKVEQSLRQAYPKKSNDSTPQSKAPKKKSLSLAKRLRQKMGKSKE